MRTQVFISYRRDGGLETAAHLYELLSPEYEIFFDMKSLRSGRFDCAIEKAISDCSDFILVLSKNIFARLDEDGDWISQELHFALAQHKNIIPIFLDGFSFPKSKNAYVNAVLNYNGIVFAESEAFQNKLKSFLVSSPKCVLPIACNKEGYYLTQEGEETLKALYRQINGQPCCDVRVSLAFPDAETSAKILLPEHERENTYAVSVRKQELLHRHRRRGELTERAIEYLLWDNCNWNDMYLFSLLRKHPLSQIVFEDKDGVLNSYQRVAYWLLVIDTLLKDFTCELSRNGCDGNNLEFSKIYACFNRKDSMASCFLKRPVNFGFKCFIPKAESGLTITNNQPRPLMSNLSAETLFAKVLPDFYYEIADILTEYASTPLAQELCESESSIYNLCFFVYSLD